ncbi:MAG: DNA topoisomerase 4 subunit A [Bacillales bacterium]|nr:DNA topoisomerase 4 subunit A [Bacillales bacterium]
MAKKKEIIQSEVYEEEIISSPIEEVMSNGFGRYSKYVLQERAVPDVRDGLKPVQRRILYTMILEGNTSNKPTRKCARTVGAVIGRFHPHGDTSVYEAMVRLSQDWKMRYPLIDFQGNNGSIDGDGPAAYRYTEARLSELSDLMVQDLNKNTVDMQLNFDDQEFEPVVLPCRFPNMLVNGTQGIAIGASTDIPPHNLSEVIDAINYRISHKNCSTEDLMQFIKGPDFPTGGIIKDQKSLLQIYKNGNGSIKLWCKVDIDTSNKDVDQIIIHEIPWGKDKSELVSNIDKCRFANGLTAILETRDETDRDGLRIVIDVKKGSGADNILNFLLSKGVLSTTIKFNSLVIDNNRPLVASLLEMIDRYIDHQVDVLTRRSQFDLNKAKNRLHIVEGLIHACSIIDQVVHTIRQSKDKQDAKIKLVNNFQFSEVQTDAILNLQLYRLSNIDIATLEKEEIDLKETINYLEGLLSSQTKMNNLIKSDLTKVKNQFGDERKTLIEEQDTSFEVDKLALINKEDVMVAITRDGYIKRSNMKSYKSAQDSLPGIKVGDAFRGILKTTTIDTLLLFTNFGNYIAVPVYKLIDNKWKEEGAHINDISSLSPNEKIVSVIDVAEYKKGVYVISLTKLGQIKRCHLYQYETSNSKKPIKCFKLQDKDEVIDVKVGYGQSRVLILSDNGTTSYYDESEIKPVGLKAGGVKGIKLDKDSKEVAGLLTIEEDEKIRLLALTNHKGVRIVDAHNLNMTYKLGAKQQLFKSFKSDPQTAIYLGKIDKKEENPSVTVLFENQEVINIDLKDVKNLPFDNYLKSNLNIINDFDMVDVYEFIVPCISEDTKVKEPLIKEDEPRLVEEISTHKAKVQDEEVSVQLSLFDFVDDD